MGVFLKKFFETQNQGRPLGFAPWHKILSFLPFALCAPSAHKRSLCLITFKIHFLKNFYSTFFFPFSPFSLFFSLFSSLFGGFRTVFLRIRHFLSDQGPRKSLKSGSKYDFFASAVLFSDNLGSCQQQAPQANFLRSENPFFL